MAYKKLKYWFDKDLAALLAEKIQKVYSSFDSQGFIQQTADGVDDLELRGHSKIISHFHAIKV